MEITGYDNIIMMNHNPGKGILRAVSYVAKLWPSIIIESCDDLGKKPFEKISNRQMRQTAFQDLFNLMFYKNAKQIAEHDSRGFFMDGDSGPFMIMGKKRPVVIGRIDKMCELYSTDRDDHELPFMRRPLHVSMHGFYEMTVVTPVRPSENKFFSSILNLILMLPKKTT